MPFTSQSVRGFNGVNGTISGDAKSNISEGAAMTGFPPGCMVFAGPVERACLGGSLSLNTPANGTGNGTYICNKDDYVTFGQITAGGFLVSDQFGGCDMTILRAPDGTIWGAHVYSSDACRAAVSAPPAGWTVLGTWTSAGYAQKHPDCGALFVFTFVESSKVMIVTVGGGGYPVTVRHVGVAAMFDA